VKSRSPTWQLAIKPASEISNPAFRKLMLYHWLNPFLPFLTFADLTSSEGLDGFHNFFSNNGETETRSRDICITALDFYDSWAERKNEIPLLTTPSNRAYGSCNIHSHAQL
jgi:hypothetical protein